MRSIIALALVAGVSVSASSLLHAQAGRGGQLRTRFDVVSVKPNVSGTRAISIRNRGWHYIGQNVSVMNLLVSAYRVAPQDVLNAPDWVRTEKFDVEAKILDADPGPAPIDRDALLRNLIIDRFKAVIRSTSTSSSGYALVIDRPDGRLGPQLKRSTLNCSSGAVQGQTGASPCKVGGDTGIIRGEGVPLARLVSVLSQRTNLAISDDTKLEGPFDFVLEWAPVQLSPPGANETAQQLLPVHGDLFTAVREQLGLRLESASTEVAAIYIERIERPTPN